MAPPFFFTKQERREYIRGTQVLYTKVLQRIRSTRRSKEKAKTDPSGSTASEASASLASQFSVPAFPPTAPQVNDDIEEDFDPDLGMSPPQAPPQPQPQSQVPSQGAFSNQLPVSQEEAEGEEGGTRQYQRWSVFDRYTISLCIHLYGYKNTKIAKLLSNRTASQVRLFLCCLFSYAALASIFLI